MVTGLMMTANGLQHSKLKFLIASILRLLMLMVSSLSTTLISLLALMISKSHITEIVMVTVMTGTTRKMIGDSSKLMK